MNNVSSLQSLDILRAEAAAKFIAGVIKGHPKEAQDVRTEIEGLAALIIKNGLLQTLVYLLAKGKKDRELLGEELVGYLANRLATQKRKGTKAALEICRNHLHNATEEALRYGYWLKLMAKAEITKNNAVEGEANSHVVPAQ
jgi:CRISPR type III-B/RAMP module-associated protein Cmr5